MNHIPSIITLNQYLASLTNGTSLVNPVSVPMMSMDEEPRCSSSGTESQMISSAFSTPPNSRCSSTESAGKIRRGRPQQEIEDGQDVLSQKKRHRRMYARQYRAQMRQKVENSKTLSEEKEIMQNEIQKLREQVIHLQAELNQRNALLSLIQLAQFKHIS